MAYERCVESSLKLTMKRLFKIKKTAFITFLTSFAENMADRYATLKFLYGEEGFTQISSAKLLVVGAGGIGCEILKNLALAGFRHVDLIDLDTIDVSNLNRQFLFRPEHVGQPKAIVAAKAAAAFNPDLKVTAYHDNIKNARFNISYFASFDLVLNALDNLDARRHVNRLCLAANVPLFDSGTTGYVGQTMPIIKNLTACYECNPKPTPKVYPICTIRSTPDKPVHCIVWAKECFKLLFARPSDSMLFEDETATGDHSTYMHLLPLPTDKSKTTLIAYARDLAIGLFLEETQKKIDMEVYKTATKVPTPINIEQIDTAAQRIVNSNQTAAPLPDQQVPDILQALQEFIQCIVEVGSSEESAALVGQLSFDKDDDWAMRFVGATSNIRSFIFGIQMLSPHDCKGIAGNIIPAIATTNAIAAGAQVAQAIKYLVYFTKDEIFPATPFTDATRDVMRKKIKAHFPHAYIVRRPHSKGWILQPTVADAPESACYVCGKAQLTLVADVNAMTLGEVVKNVFKARLGFNEPSISIGTSTIYEEGEDCDEDLQENLLLKLVDCPAGGIVDGSMLLVSDFTQNLEIEILVQHRSVEELEKVEAGTVASDLFIIEGQQAYEQRKVDEEKKTTAAASAAAQSSSSTATAAATHEDDDIMIIDDIFPKQPHVQPSSSSSSKKHAIDDVIDVDGGSPNGKRARHG